MRKSALFIRVFHVEFNIFITAVAKWAVVMNEYLSVSFIKKGCVYPKWTSPVDSLSINAAIDFMFLKFRVTNASVRVVVKYKS